MSELFSACRTLSPGESLIVGIWGHGIEGTGDVIIGRDEDDESISVREVERKIESGIRPDRRPVIDIYLVSGACFSGSWKSPSWSLIAAAESQHESISIIASNSGHSRGGTFSYCLMAASAVTHRVRIPCPSTIAYNETGFELGRESSPHDIGHPMNDRMPSPLPWKSMSQLGDWLNGYRAKFRRLLYDTTKFTTFTTEMFPVPEYTAHFHSTLCVVPPNPKRDNLEDQPTGSTGQGTIRRYSPSHRGVDVAGVPQKPWDRKAVASNSIPPFLRTHDFRQEVEFLHRHSLSGGGARASQVGVYLAAQRYHRAPDETPPEKLFWLQQELKKQHRIQCLFWLLACSLGWEQEARKLWKEGFTFRLCDEAVRISSEQTRAFTGIVKAGQEALGIRSTTRWMDPAYWIRGVWRTAGCPDVNGLNWAYEFSLVKAYVPQS